MKELCADVVPVSYINYVLFILELTFI